MKKLVIKPYRQNMGMDATRAQEIWQSLRKAIEEIFSHNASQLSFEELYRNSYNLVLHKHGDLLYNGVVSVITERLESVANEVTEVSDDLLLVLLNQKWTDHQIIMTMIRDILMYMDRTYVNQKRKHPIYDHGLYIFRDVIVRHPSIRERLRQALLRNVSLERNGELIDRGLMKNMLRMLVELGVRSNLVYEEEFESFFLEKTSEFYRTEAQMLMDQHTCPEYLHKAEKRLQEEVDRVVHYLNISTEFKLKTIVETQFIKNHAKTLVEMKASGCLIMFRDDKVDDLRRMYVLFRRVPDTLTHISDSVQEYIKKNGTELVEAQGNPEISLEAPAFMEKLLNLRHKFMYLLTECFFDDAHFQRHIKHAFEKFMNIGTTCASYLAQYIDDLLRSKTRFEEELETRVAQVIGLFRYLQDKDIFEEYYKILLAKRLLHHGTGRSSGPSSSSTSSSTSSSSASDEAEQIVISKLKAECGYQFTSKLEGMFKDMTISKGLMDVFRKVVSTGVTAENEETSLPSSWASIQLNVQVLTSGYWPTETISMCNLPAELNQWRKIFENFYLARHNGRKITWMSNMGSVDLRAVFYGSNTTPSVEEEHVVVKKNRHELSVSTFQAVILMLFNQKNCWSFQEIATMTQIELQDLKRHLISLCTPKYKILIKSSKGKRINEEQDTFTVNEEYKSKLHRVRIPLVSQKESSLLPAIAGVGTGGTTSTSNQDLPPTVAEDRKHLVEASIVRIMKTRKSMQHNNLIAEVTRQMSGRFTPTPQLIKLRIESLIEREYLQRSSADRRVYNYLA